MSISCIDDKDYSDVHSVVASMIRPCDAAILLPGACISSESKTMKNVVFELNGSAPSVPLQLFSPSWGHGVSVVRLDTNDVEARLRERRQTVNSIVSAIPNELRDRSVEVGPALLDCDGRDTDPWRHGFDSTACCAGIYSADEIRTPDGCNTGTSRVHRVYYAVAKAGAGRAAQEFHAKLSQTLRSGVSLDQAFASGIENGLTVESIRRVEDAGMRNRSRIIASMMDAIGMSDFLSLVPDCANCPSDYTRRPVLLVNSVTNSIVHVDGSSAGYNHDLKGRWRYYAGSLNGIASDGICVCSNASHGMMSYITANGEYSVKLRNIAYDSLPFGTRKISSITKLASTLGAEYKKTPHARSVHPDAEWIRDHFGWLPHGQQDWPDVEPAPLWGTHESINWHSTAHKLALSDLRSVHMRPEAVALAGNETSKLRAIYKASQ